MTRVLLFVSYAVGKDHSGVTGPEIRTREMLRFLSNHRSGYSDVSIAMLYARHGQIYDDFKDFEKRGIIKLYEYEIKGRVSHFTALYRAIRDFRPHVIHSQGGILPDFATVVSSKFFRCGSVITRPVLISDELLSPLWRKLYFFLQKHVIQYADRFVSISRTAQSRWHEELGRTKQSRDRLIYNGIDIERFQKVGDLSLRDNVRHFAVIAQLTQVKGHDLLLQAMADSDLLRQRARVSFIGNGPLRKSLRQQIADLGLKDRVHLTGFVNNIPEAMREVDIVVLPSRREGFPVSILEAFAAGRPVIASDTGAVKELVDSEVGILIPPGNVSALKEAMENLCLIETGKLKQMGYIAKERVKQYDLKFMVDNYINLYREFGS